MPFLEINDLTLHYATPRGPVRAVDGMSLRLEQAGATLGVIGESGSGKTSLGLALMRLLPRNIARYGGQVLFDGSDLMQLSDDAFRRQVRWRAISMVFQGAMNSLNPVMRVGEQIAEPLVTNAHTPKAEAMQRTGELLTMVGLSKDIAERYPHELSGGMKQRAVIPMALVMDPKLVILDEPTSALDVSVQAQIMNFLKQLQRERSLSLLFITHDIALASDICDAMAVVYGGQVVETGTAEQVLRSPQHPYTQRLIASIPRLHAKEPPQFAPGAPPDLVSPPTGCRFHPRCPAVFEPCDAKEPPLFNPGAGRAVRCWLQEKPGRV